MKNKISKKVNQILKNISIALMMFMILGNQVYAANVPMIDGTKRLIADVTTGVLLLVAGAAGLIGVKNGLQWLAADEDEKPRYKKNVRNTALIAAITISFSGIIQFVLSYYGG